MDRSTILLTVTALLGAILASRPELFASLGPGANAAPPGASAQLSALRVLKTELLVTSSSSGKSPLLPVPILVGYETATSSHELVLRGSWLSFETRKASPLFWGPAAAGELRVAPGSYFLAEAYMAPPAGTYGAGVIEMRVCTPPSTTRPAETCTPRTEHPVALARAASNESFFSIPAMFSISCLALGTLTVLVLARQTPNKFAALSNHSFHWNVGDTWAANLNIGAALVNSFTAIGLSPEALRAFATPKEYGAWLAIFALSTALAPSLFSLLMVPDSGAPSRERGSLLGFYLANAFNLFGAGGQLYIAHLAFDSLGDEILAPVAAKSLSWLPIALATGIAFYVAVRFLLLQAAPPSSEGRSRSNML